jgi:hypothetical protein
LSAQISAPDSYRDCGKKFVDMKIRLEEVKPDADSSFRILQPKLNHLFYWHFHPEYEIVFIEGANGTRHVGDHLAKFEGSDLVFIGPNIPHPILITASGLPTKRSSSK